MSNIPVRSVLTWAAAVAAVLVASAGTVYAGRPQGSVPELGSGAALTALTLFAGASLILRNRRSK
jgi:hypothetical protein